MRSSLAPYANLMRDPDPAKQREVAHELWHRHQILVVFPEDLGTKIERMWPEAIGRKLYGKRGN